MVRKTALAPKVKPQIEQATRSLMELSDEVEVMERLGQGKSLKAISKELSISVSTVKARIQSAFKSFTLAEAELRQHIRIETYQQSKYLIEKGFSLLDNKDLTPAIWKTVAETWLQITKYQAELFALSTTDSKGNQINQGIVINDNRISGTVTASENDPLYSIALDQIKQNYASRYGSQVQEYEKLMSGKVEEVNGELEIIVETLEELEDADSSD